MALNPVKPLYSASATATNGSTTVTVTGNVNCSFLSSGSIVAIGTRQLVDAIAGTAPDGSGNSTITLRRAWTDPTTTAPMLAFMSYEGLADAVVRLRQIIDASEAGLEGAFSYLGAWDASAGDFPPTPGEGLGSQMYRISVAGTMGGRAYRVGEPIYYDQFTSQWRSFFDLATAFSTGLLASSDAAAWRTSLGLGTAATANVTTSPTDTTAGRMLKVGDGGFLNGSAMPTTLENLNDATANRGLSAQLSSALNVSPLPPSFSISGRNNIFSFGHPAYPAQIIAQADGRMAFRVGNSTNFDNLPFNTFYHDKNILGTVSQSAGVPTGAIIQRGSNANGEFVRFADGTLICIRSVSVVTSVTLSAGGSFRSSLLTAPLPSNAVSGFNGRTIVSGGDLGNNVWLLGDATSSVSEFAYRAMSVASISSTTVQGNLYFIGRWY